MAKKMKAFFNNKNGNIETIEEFLMLVKSKDFSLKDFRVEKDKCPPKELITKTDNKCFYCIECWKNCENAIKEYKHHYQIGKKKIKKEDVFNEGRMY